MSNSPIQDFEAELKISFDKYLKHKPAQDDSFDGAMKRIMWMKDTVQNINEESVILINKHAKEDDQLKKEMQTISLAATKKIMTQMKS